MKLEIKIEAFKSDGSLYASHCFSKDCDGQKIDFSNQEIVEMSSFILKEGDDYYLHFEASGNGVSFTKIVDGTRKNKRQKITRLIEESFYSESIVSDKTGEDLTDQIVSLTQ